ncbi:MAG: Crp/Fnr family transcriptional regulator [Stellaceae bacterium]
METLLDAPPSAVTQLLRRFKDSVPITPDELPVVRELGWEIRTVRRRQAILTEGAKNRAVYFVLDGYLIRYRILRDGQRQIVDLAIPGDFAGVPSCFFQDSLYTIKALTNATVAVAPLERLVALFETQPRLAAKIFWSFSCDAAIHAEHLIVVGRRAAHERIAHFLLELLTRLQAVGLADEHSFELPLSQEVIGDALGLSLAYVNRVLRRLADDGLVTIKDQKVTISDVDELAFMADFERGYLKPLPISEFGTASWNTIGVESRI